MGLVWQDIIFIFYKWFWTELWDVRSSNIKHRVTNDVERFHPIGLGLVTTVSTECTELLSLLLPPLVSSPNIIIYYSCNSIQEVLRLRLNIKESFWEYFEYSILTFTHFMFYDFMENKLCWFWNWVYKNTQNKSSLRTETLHSK